MLISVDFPAPFSPRSACTSPRWRSKSMWSLARTPGNCFVMPRSSRTGAPSIPRDSTAQTKGRAREPAPSNRLAAAAERRRRLELAGNDLLLQRRDLIQPRLLEMRPRAELPERDAVVLQVEDEIAAALVALPGLRAFNGEEDPDVHPLYRAREDVRPKERLVDIDADPPPLSLLRRIERSEATRPCDVEDDLRARVDLVLRDALALRLIDEVLGVADLHGCAGHASHRASPVARQECVDRRNLHAADHADVLLSRPLRHVRGEAADEVAVLLRRVRQSFDVLHLSVERRPLHRLVRDGELRIRELLGHVVRRIGEQEAGRDDDVEALPRQRRHVRQVVTRGP